MAGGMCMVVGGEHVWQGGSLLPGGVVSDPGGCLIWGGLVPGGSALGGVSQHALRQNSPPPCEQNDKQV